MTGRNKFSFIFCLCIVLMLSACYAENSNEISVKEKAISIINEKIAEGVDNAIRGVFNCVMIIVPDTSNYIYISNAYEILQDDKSLSEEKLLNVKQLISDKIPINNIKKRINYLARKKLDTKRVIFAVNGDIPYSYLQEIINEYEISLADIEQKDEVLFIKYEFLEPFQFVR